MIRSLPLKYETNSYMGSNMIKKLVALLVLCTCLSEAQVYPPLTTGRLRARGLTLADSGIVVSTSFNFKRVGYFRIQGDTAKFDSQNDSLRIWTKTPTVGQVLTADANGIYRPATPAVIDSVGKSHVADSAKNVFKYRVAGGTYYTDSLTLKGLVNITITRSNDTITITGVDSVTNSHKADFSTEEHSFAVPIGDSLNTTSIATTIPAFSPVWSCTIDSVIAYKITGTGNIAVDRVTGGSTWAPLFASTALGSGRTSITIIGNSSFSSTNELRIRVLSPSSLAAVVYVYWHRSS